ncbi:usherin isoform X2 [Vanacampus margaritifer]
MRLAGPSTKDPKTDRDAGSPAPPEGPMGGERVESGQADGRPVFQELWFMAVMAAIALLLMAVALGVALHKLWSGAHDMTTANENPALQVLKKAPLSRERPPLVAMQKRSPMAVYPASNSVLFDTAGVVSSVTLKSFTIKTEALEAKCEDAGAQGNVRDETSLRRSVSQVMDRKSEAWGHDSGMFMDDEEFVDSVKGFSTTRKEHTMFTDTNL